MYRAILIVINSVFYTIYTYDVVFFAQVNGDAVAYGGIGSGGGVRNLRDKIIDFAGSDAFLSDKELAEMEP